MHPEVLDAMQAAAGAFVDLPELNERAGRYLAEKIGVEAAFVSCGAASGMQLSAAACLTGTDAEKVRSLPHTEGWRNEFVVSLVDSHTYIHQGIEICGGRAGAGGQQDGGDGRGHPRRHQRPDSGRRPFPGHAEQGAAQGGDCRGESCRGPCACRRRGAASAEDEPDGDCRISARAL